jgi:integrase
MFNEAVRLELIEKNPLAKIAKPPKSETPPEIFTVEELTALLEAAQQIAPDVLPMIAIGAFAGVRTDIQDGEIRRVEWSAIDLKRGHIDMSAAVTKRAKRRIIPVQPNLAAWLAPYSGMQRRVMPKGARGKLKKVRKAAGVEWKDNALRHSFASYRMAAINDAPRVAAELGHPNPALLYNTYRELVMPEEATRYWQIAPNAVEKVIAFSAGA